MNLIFVIIGYIGSITLSLSFIPQVIKAYKSKEVKSISKKFLLLQYITTLFWTTYGIGFILDKNLNGLPILIANCFILICLILLTIAIYKYNSSNKNNNSNINTNSPNCPNNSPNTNFNLNSNIIIV